MNNAPINERSRSMERSAVERISRTITRLLRDHPFFGSLALRLPIVLDASRSTIATDGLKLFANPLWVDEADVYMLETAIARIVFACTLKHHTRRDERIPEVWQLASQLVTHDYIRDCGFRLPEGTPTISDVSVEEAYEMLLDDAPEDPQDCRQPRQDISPAGNDEDCSSGQSGDSADSDDDRTGSDTNDSDSNAGQSDTDDGRDNTESSVDQPDNVPENRSPDAGDDSVNPPASHDPHGTGEIMDAPRDLGPDPDLDRAVGDHERDWDNAMHQAAAFAKAQGNMPGTISELIDAALRVQLHWRDLLRKYATDESRSDYTWSYPNRRFIADNLYLPSIRSQDGISTMAVIVDTSCSVRKSVLSEILGEIRHLAEVTQTEEIHFLQVDHALQSAETLTCYDIPDSMEFPGRGGTSFVPGFEWLKENRIRPTVCIYLTDMECTSYPDEEPNYPVVWINWEPPTIDELMPPWGRVIDIE